MTRHDDSKEIFLELAVEDVSRACDLLRAAWERSGDVDGYVSIEVDPDLAYDRDASYDEAIRLRARRPSNAYVRSRTVPGLGDRGLHRGRPLDQRHADLLARRHAEGRRGVRPWAPSASSRTAAIRPRSSRWPASSCLASTPRRIGGSRRSAASTSGKLAIANAKLAYQHYLKKCSRAALGRARRAGRADAALSLDVDEEPGLP